MRELHVELPPSLAHYRRYKGVWINTSHLDHVGVSAGSLALVVEGEPDRGEPAAIMEISSGEISCGIYDADFGIVCLEGQNGEPVLFDEAAVKVLGKIVGVCRDRRNAHGHMVAEPLRSEIQR
jgi:hypothetical protein